MNKKILCIDMDAFFASVEQASNPALSKVPMAVAGAGERTVILSVSYIARKKGVRTGQTVGEAMRACPNLQIAHASGKKYTYISKRIAEFLHSVSPTARMYSIDEAFMDITDLPESSQEIGYRIKAWLKEKLKITGSVGVGESYILAKMASDASKPDGFCEVPPDERLLFMDRFKLKSIWGIGRQTTEKLASLGLFTPADVRRFGQDRLEELYGIPGVSIYRACCGLDREHPIGKEEPLKSISHSITTPADVSSLDIALAYLLQLSEAVSARARQQMYAGQTVSLTVREAGMKTYSFRKKLGFFTSATHHIYYAAKKLFLSNVSLDMPLRLFGVGLDGLVYGSVALANLEDTMNDIDRDAINLYNAIDRINEKYRNGVIRGSVLKIGYRGPLGIPPSIKSHSDIEKMLN